MELWMQIALGALAVIAMFRFLPGIRGAVANSRKGNAKEWLGLLFPIGVVVLFVLFLILSVK